LWFWRRREGMFILDGFNDKELQRKKEQFISFWKEALGERFAKAPKSFQGDFPNIVERIIENNDHGLAHAATVWISAKQLTSLIEGGLGNFPPSKINSLLEEACIFHDAGRFFVPREDHCRYKEMQEKAIKEHHIAGVDLAMNLGCKSFVVTNTIRCHDFFNKKITPHVPSPRFLLGEVVRLADKISLPPSQEVDRYWETGKRLGTPFFLPDISLKERTSCYLFASRDQLNYFLAMFLLSPQDFSHPVLQEAYRSWEKGKREAMERILTIAQKEVGLKGETLRTFLRVIDEWKKATNCQW